MGSIIGAVTDPLLGTDLQGKKAAGAALGYQQDATNTANAASLQAYNDQKNYLNPYLTGGQTAFQNLLSGNMQMDPGYQFRLSEGQKAINNAASARGMYGGGSTLKALTRYGQDYASNEYQNAFNRQNTLANYGFQGANNLGNFAGQYGQQIGNNAIGMGNSQAAGAIAQGNRASNDVNQLIQGGVTLASAYMGMPKPSANSYSFNQNQQDINSSPQLNYWGKS